ncbi:MBL fold metallo-hydrolase [Telluria beijingensis]|uniref:MBL fold metallo-hydrolase n=1 Tax=Telluria beijingensis TaxID=3068633 RepID=UPI002796354C|nr:MBL fold metallo-hydrolase [Massilia sp. REN29]
MWSRYASIVSLGLAALSPFHAQAESPAPAQWVTLGTVGGPIVHADQAQISNALVVGDAVYLFDLGSGVLRQAAAANIPLRQLRAVFLSHHHPDHNADLGPVMLAKWLRGRQEPMPIVGPRGTQRLVNGIVDGNAATEDASYAVQGPANLPLASAFRAQDLPDLMEEPQLVYEDDRIRVLSISVEHYEVPPSAPIAKERRPLAVAFRVETAGKVYVYSGDTGPTRRLARLAKGADVLVTEVVHPEAIADYLRKTLKGASADFADGAADRMRKSHLTPQDIGKIAAEAGVQSVVLTHFVPALGTQSDPNIFTRGISPAYTGPVSLAKDLDRF